MSPRRRAAAVLVVVATVLAGAACRWYSLERRLDPANADFLSQGRLHHQRRGAPRLPPAARTRRSRSYIEEFWARRNPDPSSPENAFKVEYFKRIEEADRLFPSEGRPGWLTDRGRILILFGPPMQRDVQAMSGGGRPRPGGLVLRRVPGDLRRRLRHRDVPARLLGPRRAARHQPHVSCTS